MKSDRDFLNGIYHKAEVLKKLDYAEKKPNLKLNSKWLIAAATLTLVVSLNIYNNTSTPMKIQADNSRQTPSAARFINSIDIASLTEDADIIVRAKVNKIHKSVYENNILTTTVELSSKEILKGTLENKNIDLVVMGGFDKKSNTYVDYEAIFDRNEDTLLFLNKIDGKFYLTYSSQGKYTHLKTSDTEITYKGSSGEIITLSQIKELIKKER